MKNEAHAKLAARGLLHNPLIGGTNDAHYWPGCAHQIIVAAVAAAKRYIRVTKHRAATTRFARI